MGSSQKERKSKFNLEEEKNRELIIIRLSTDIASGWPSE